MHETLFTPEVFIKHWPDLQEFIDESETDDRFEKIVGHLCEKSTFIKEVQELDDGFNYENADLYLVICKVSLSKSFREWCRIGLEGLDARIWRLELEEGGNALRLMLTLMESGINVALRQPYQDALVDYAKGALNGSVALSNDIISLRAKIIAGLGTDASRAVFRSRLCQAAIDQDGQCADGFFEMFGDEIADKSTLSENGSTVVKLFSPLIRERAIGGLRWLKDVIYNSPELLDKYIETASVQDFRERLQGELGKTSEEDGEIHNLIKEIADSLGVKHEEIPSEDKAESEGSMPEDSGSEREVSNEK